MNKVVTGVVVTIVCIGLVATGAYLVHRHIAAQSGAAADDAAGNEVKPTATVTVAPLTAGSLTMHVTAFGAVVARPELTQVISVPFESQTTQISVSVGQRVSNGQLLLQVRPSLAARATLDDARNSVAAAERDLALVKQRYDQKLATNSDLFAAQNALRTAQNHLTGLAQVDPAKPLDLKSDADCIITKIDTQSGQTIPTGGPLIETIQIHNVQARLAIDSSTVADLKAGQAVELTATNRTGPIAASIAAITNHVDPATHLVDVYAQMPANTLALDTPLVAKLDLSHGDGFIVPHDAVVPDEDGNYELFTVKAAKAIKHTVRVLVEDDDQTQISAPDLTAGDSVVIVGNYVLEDGMAVNAENATAASTRATVATTRPEPGDEK